MNELNDGQWLGIELSPTGDEIRFYANNGIVLNAITSRELKGEDCKNPYVQFMACLVKEEELMITKEETDDAFEELMQVLDVPEKDLIVDDLPYECVTYILNIESKKFTQYIYNTMFGNPLVVVPVAPATSPKKRKKRAEESGKERKSPVFVTADM